MRRLAVMFLVGCGPKPVPAGPPGQSVHDAMVLVCDAPVRAKHDGGSRSDAIAGHLTDGVSNREVLLTAEGWKTDGVNNQELDRLIKEAGLSKCPLRDETR